MDRSISLNGKAYSPLLDSVRAEFESRNLSCQSVAFFGSSLTGVKGFGEPFSINKAYVLQLIRNKLCRLLGLPKRYEGNVFAWILDKTGAKLILTIGSPSDLVLAATEKGIFHVELLHVIGCTYLPWGWDYLPPSMLPKGVLSMDNISTKSFTPLTKKGIEVYTIPHPFLKRFIPTKFDSLPDEWKTKVNRDDKYYKHILVSLTWGYAGDHGPHVHLANILNNGLFFDEIGELVKKNPTIFWRFRFHPVQVRMPRYKNLIKFMDQFIFDNPNAEWRESSRLPFPSVALRCDGNINMSSMSCYDAAASGVPSLVLCPSVQKGGIHQDLFIDLEVEGYITKTEVNQRVLEKWVQQTHKVKPRLTNLEDDGAWEDAIAWMLQKSALDRRTMGRVLR